MSIKNGKNKCGVILQCEKLAVGLDFFHNNSFNGIYNGLIHFYLPHLYRINHRQTDKSTKYFILASKLAIKWGNGKNNDRQRDRPNSTRLHHKSENKINE